MIYCSIRGSYGGCNTPCEIFVCAISGGNAYCIQGSRDINLTRQPLTEGVWVEGIEDYDSFWVRNPIYEVHDLLEELEEVGL